MNNELAELIERFLNETGQFYQFKEWIEAQGYTLTELGIEDDDD